MESDWEHRYASLYFFSSTNQTSMTISLCQSDWQNLESQLQLSPSSPALNTGFERCRSNPVDNVLSRNSISSRIFPLSWDSKYGLSPLLDLASLYKTRSAPGFCRPIPPILHACHESRNEFLANMKPTNSKHSHPTYTLICVKYPVYFSFEIDTLFIGREGDKLFLSSVKTKF